MEILKIICSLWFFPSCTMSPPNTWRNHRKQNQSWETSATNPHIESASQAKFNVESINKKVSIVTYCHCLKQWIKRPMLQNITWRDHSIKDNKTYIWANILWLTDTSAHLFWISWRMLQSKYSNILDGRLDFCRNIRI